MQSRNLLVCFLFSVIFTPTKSFPSLYLKSVENLLTKYTNKKSPYLTENNRSSSLHHKSSFLSMIPDDTENVDQHKDTNVVTILGFGSLLSEKSSRSTFPNLTNFRLGRVKNYRRVFGHPASIFFQRGIANMETLEISSLCAEFCGGHEGFICSVFEVSNEKGEFSSIESNEFVPSMAFREREEEFEIILVPYLEKESSSSHHDKKGILCTRSSDENYLILWGKERFQNNYGNYNIGTIWNWKEDSGLKPCAPYLRHCVLAAEKMGKECFDSFLDETYLVDRHTTIRQYLKENPSVMETLPPPELAERYGG